MPKTHEVKRGECLLSICADYGFTDWKPIFDHPENKELKAKRPDPNLLLPGDRIYIPDPRPKTVTLATGERHEVVVKRPTVWLKLKVLDHVEGEREPADYQLTVEGLPKPLTGTLGADGVLEVEVPAVAQTARLLIQKDGAVLERFELAIGALAPPDSVQGVQERLTRLGFPCGEVDGELGPRTERAIRLFRTRFGIEEEDLPGGATVNKLKELAGC